MSEEYNPDALEEQAEESSPIEGTAEITNIEPSTVGKEYSGSSNMPGESQNLAIDNPERNCIVVEVEVEDLEQPISDIFPEPKSEQSWSNPNFKLGQFRSYYGSVPREGMEIEYQTNQETGFVEIVY
ncbi:hypothetical protein [Methanohalobium sp.]|uniref:hypothetical protein n=1 Tax=Methanohalobium sp. TaxID=2837493 RepID=UPI0025F52617|nr:hypothetical protein [Methanohalobium sp.]